MTKTVLAPGGALLDQILFAEHGSTRQIAEVFDANPGLAALPLLIPAGTPVIIPDRDTAPVTTVRLYD